MTRTLAPLLALSLLAGCGAVYENRIESALVGAGLREPVAQCIAGRMVDQLSKAQIHQIAALKSKADKKLPKMSMVQFLRQHGGDLDAHTVSVLTRAGLVCSVTN
ncbi:MAG TPA: hypothetical protein VGB70_00130 [Allosphingosinicella sp.]|jgi:hypothetical protein